MNKAIFLDKDGTLIPDIPYNVDPALIFLQEDAVEGLKTLSQNGYLLIIISNQAGVAKGYFSEDKLQGVHHRMKELFKQHELVLDGFYYCPHHTEGIVKEYVKDCNCRKPMPGMILQAAKDFDIDLSQSWMVGDILNDVEAGNRAGCKTVLIDNGNETEWVQGEYRTPDYTCKNINEAAGNILKKNWHELAEL
jgi:D-glycero-D-manno-heptose 1,7-bisphosphate phosphatase